MNAVCIAFILIIALAVLIVLFSASMLSSRISEQERQQGKDV